MIDYLLNEANLEGIAKKDFSDLLYCYNLLIVAQGSIGNTCAIQFYIKEIDKDSFVIPEEIKDAQIDIEMNIQELGAFVDNW